MRIDTRLYGQVTLLDKCPLIGATETLEFVTAMSESFDGFEERDCLRDIPKHSITVDYNSMSDYFDVEYRDIRRMWAIPFNQESQYVGDIETSATEIACNTNSSDFRPSSLAILSNGSTFRVVEISDVSDGFLTLYEPLTTGLMNASIAPLRVGYIDGDIQRTFNTTHVSSAFNFRVWDAIDLDDGDISDQYKGEDIYFFNIFSSSGQYEANITKQQDFIDYDIGGFYTRTRHNHGKVMRNWEYHVDNTEDLYTFKKFLFRRKGMFRPFWLPLYEKTLKLKSTGLIGSFIHVERTDYIDRKNLALNIDGEWVAVGVTSIVNVNGNTTRLNLDSSLDVDANLISSVSYLGLHRFNSDTIDIEYDGNGYASTSIPITEIEP